MPFRELRAVRAQWYGAYVAGDTRRLAELEDESFFVIGESGIQTRDTQLLGIANAVRLERWFPSGSRAEDERLVFQAVSDDIVSAHGIGSIRMPGGENPPVVFTELWRRSEAGWRVMHLHYHAVAR